MKHYDIDIIILGYILLRASKHFSWEPLTWIGIPVFLIGLVFTVKNTWTGWRSKTLTGRWFWLRLFLLFVSILYLIIELQQHLV